MPSGIALKESNNNRVLTPNLKNFCLKIVKNDVNEFQVLVVNSHLCESPDHIYGNSQLGDNLAILA